VISVSTSELVLTSTLTYSHADQSFTTDLQRPSASPIKVLIISTSTGFDTQGHPFTSLATYPSFSTILPAAAGTNLGLLSAAVDIVNQELSLKTELVITTITGLDAENSPYTSILTNTATLKEILLTTTGVDAAGIPFTSIMRSTLMPTVRYLTTVGLDSLGHTVTRIVGEAPDSNPTLFLYTTTGIDSIGHSFTSVVQSTLKTEAYSSYTITYIDRDGSTHTSVLQTTLLPQDFYYTITGVDGNGKTITRTLQKPTTDVEVSGTLVVLPVEPSTAPSSTSGKSHLSITCWIHVCAI
jgi:hypothetical protein